MAGASHTQESTQQLTRHSAMIRWGPINNYYLYDAAGNMTHDASHSYAYDAENRLISVDANGTATYIYDALGHRVRKTTNGVSSDLIYNAGNVVAEWNSVCHCWALGYVYGIDGFLAQYA